MRLAGNNQVVNTYVAMQAAIPAHCYDSSTTINSTRTPPDRYAHYYADGSASYFSGTAGAERYIDFFNVNDFALSYWNVDQGLKPDYSPLSYPGYHYSSSSGRFYKITGVGANNIHYFAFPGDTYEIFAYGDPSWSFALGAQANVGGSFLTSSQVELDQLPYSFGSTHKFHSGQFRSDNMSRAVFWEAVLQNMNLLR